MSIHTILSQEIDKLRSEYDLQKASVGRKISLTKALETFATRIVEEVGKELIEELKVRHDEHICSGCGEGFSCDYEDVYEEIRTKLQKMKEI